MKFKPLNLGLVQLRNGAPTPRLVGAAGEVVEVGRASRGPRRYGERTFEKVAAAAMSEGQPWGVMNDQPCTSACWRLCAACLRGETGTGGSSRSSKPPGLKVTAVLDTGTYPNGIKIRTRT